MISCYVLTGITLVLLSLTAAQGYWGFSIFNANHATFALLTSIIYLFTETLVMFYFVGIGVSIRDYVNEQGLPKEFLKRSFQVKMKIYPPILLNIFLVSILFILGGAVDTNRIAKSIHGWLFWATLAHFFYMLVIQHKAFKDSTDIVLDMSGVSRPQPKI